MQLELVWSAQLPLHQLRPWLREQLAVHGEPLRWAITAVEFTCDQSRKLKIEAVVVSPET
ncbi:hypothetical protein EV13_1631 [Prochlorococcus sp. MIT 0702]|nr:hypothetical protein EV13_1631 [Prochlorococcus sp. MIT 0702]KGG28695.1 hypothetical protein EV12_0590 [Prochlorococcus sp. MIT 0701]KGG36339.1 hypothetical protein EV14_0433 [Prochlorococcus sp. MIT 0703]